MKDGRILPRSSRQLNPARYAVVITTTAQPAGVALRIPFGESSTWKVFSVRIPCCATACRYGSGSAILVHASTETLGPRTTRFTGWPERFPVAMPVQSAPDAPEGRGTLIGHFLSPVVTPCVRHSRIGHSLVTLPAAHAFASSESTSRITQRSRILASRSEIFLSAQALTS